MGSQLSYEQPRIGRRWGLELLWAQEEPPPRCAEQTFLGNSASVPALAAVGPRAPQPARQEGFGKEARAAACQALLLGSPAAQPLPGTRAACSHPAATRMGVAI